MAVVVLIKVLGSEDGHTPNFLLLLEEAAWSMYNSSWFLVV